MSKENSFYCEDCRKTKLNKEMVMLTDEWIICRECFESDRVSVCEYSPYCEYTGKCDEQC